MSDPLRQLVEQLKEYTRHKDGCTHDHLKWKTVDRHLVLDGTQPCNCGLDQLAVLLAGRIAPAHELGELLTIADALLAYAEHRAETPRLTREDCRVIARSLAASALLAGGRPTRVEEQEEKADARRGTTGTPTDSLTAATD